MHTIKYKKCIAQQNNKTLMVTVSDGIKSIAYPSNKRLSGKELRTMVNLFLRESEG